MLTITTHCTPHAPHHTPSPLLLPHHTDATSTTQYHQHHTATTNTPRTPSQPHYHHRCPPHTITTTLPHYHHAMPTDHQHRHTTTTRYPSHTITTTLPPPDTHKYLRMAHPQRHVVLHQLCAVHVRTGTALVLARASKGLCIVVAKDRRVGNAPPAMHRACTKARPWVGMCER